MATEPTLVRFALTVAIAVSFAGQAVAACLGVLDFEKRGGHLIEVQRIDLANIPDDFFCDRVVCRGGVGFKGIIDKAGRVRALKITLNTWSVRPQEHADIIRVLASSVRYRPPKLGGRLLCVKMAWRYNFDQKMKERAR